MFIDGLELCRKVKMMVKWLSIYLFFFNLLFYTKSIPTFWCSYCRWCCYDGSLQKSGPVLLACLEGKNCDVSNLENQRIENVDQPAQRKTSCENSWKQVETMEGEKDYVWMGLCGMGMWLWLVEKWTSVWDVSLFSGFVFFRFLVGSL